MLVGLDASYFNDLTLAYSFGCQGGEPVVVPHNQHLVDHVFEQSAEDEFQITDEYYLSCKAMASASGKFANS